MKTVVFFAHPGLNGSGHNGMASRINKGLFDAANTDKNLTIVDISTNTNIVQHQKLMEESDRIVLQFPMYWFNFSSIAKKWLDDVLEYNWAYGENFKLSGKEFMLSFTTGQPASSFVPGGRVGITADELFPSVPLIAAYTKMKILPSFKIHDANSVISEEALTTYKQEFLKHINSTF